MAVSSIVRGGIPGIPYIIFGPPGTGKTVTMVEAIHQIWKTNNKANMAVTAPSNSAADLLAERLAQDCGRAGKIPRSQILRYIFNGRAVVFELFKMKFHCLTDFIRTEIIHN